MHTDTPSSADTSADRYRAPALDKGLDILELLSEYPDGLTRAEIVKALGRSPIKHLTYLRMRKAAEILSTTDHKIETIALALGYENPFAFSNTFLKWIGVRPSEHRK